MENTTVETKVTTKRGAKIKAHLKKNWWKYAIGAAGTALTAAGGILLGKTIGENVALKDYIDKPIKLTDRTGEALDRVCEIAEKALPEAVEAVPEIAEAATETVSEVAAEVVENVL